MKRQALISQCGRFRYRLSRTWGPGKRLAYCMLNPSTADADVDDPTIRKCIGFAERNSFDAIDVVNLFAFRATDPRDLRRAGYQVGEDNDHHITEVAQGASALVLAWGANAQDLERPQRVLPLLRRVGITLLALKISKKGHPCHPLMLSYACKPFPFSLEAIGSAMHGDVQ